jgi:hypothetical protein
MTSSRIEGPASLRPTICEPPDRSRRSADRPSGRLGGRFVSDGHSLSCQWRTNFDMALSASSFASRRVVYDCGDRR